MPWSRPPVHFSLYLAFFFVFWTSFISEKEVRAGNKLVFLVLREGTCTIQAVLARSETIPVDTIKLVARFGALHRLLYTHHPNC